MSSPLSPARPIRASGLFWSASLALPQVDTALVSEALALLMIGWPGGGVDKYTAESEWSEEETIQAVMYVL